MSARLIAGWRRLTATTLACLVGRHDSCGEMAHGLAPGQYCHCPHHPELLHAAKEAAR